MNDQSPTKPRKAAEMATPAPVPPLRRVLRWAGRIAAGIAVLYAALILMFSFVPPPINFYQLGEAARLGGIGMDISGRDCR